MSDTVREEWSVASRPQSPKWWRVLDAVAIVALLPTVLALFARWWWIGDLCVHFPVPYIVAAALLAMVYLWQRRWKWLAAVCVVLSVNVGHVWPLFAVQQAATADSMPLRVMVANVHIDNPRTQPILDQVQAENPDVLVLIEVDERGLSELAELNATYPLTTHVLRGYESAPLGPFGLAIYSRFPLSDTRTLWLGSARTPTLVTTVTGGEQPWTLVAAHPYPPVSPVFSQARNTLLAELAHVVAGIEGPTIVAGDLNITRWSPHFADLLSIGGLDDSAVGYGYQPTWPSIPVIPIDHILVSPDVAVLNRRVGASIASDHRPVIADLAVRQNKTQTAISH